jgi:uncharacterized membrane protein YfhO
VPGGDRWQRRRIILIYIDLLVLVFLNGFYLAYFCCWLLVVGCWLLVVVGRIYSPDFPINCPGN